MMAKNGYCLVELYASLTRKNPVPVLLEPFSHEEPYSPGQNPVVLAAVRKIFELTGNRGATVVDRGFDGCVMFEDWLDNKYRFVTRLVGNRHLLRFLAILSKSKPDSGCRFEQICLPSKLQLRIAC